MNIISASRRTDIPKFYAKWFMARIREGRAAYRNPYSGKLHEVSLRPEDVRAIVFWSKDYRPLERHLDELDERGFLYYFQFTITGLPRIFEERVPETEIAVATARRLAARTSAEHVNWRFDPIVLSNATDAAETIARFEGLARRLEGATRRCSISFMEFYAKVRRNLVPLEGQGARFHDPPIAEKREIAARLAAIGARHGIAVVSCCNDAIVQQGSGFEVGKGRCVDAALLDALFPDPAAPPAKPGPTREACGCALSRDIGAYDTCPHGCFYCYANANPDLARRRHATHDPNSLTLG